MNESMDVIIVDDAEAHLVHSLVAAYELAFSVADRVSAIVQLPDHVMSQVLMSHKQAIREAKRQLCGSVALSRRRGQLIALAQALADAGSGLVFDQDDEAPASDAGDPNPVLDADPVAVTPIPEAFRGQPTRWDGPVSYPDPEESWLSVEHPSLAQGELWG